MLFNSIDFAIFLPVVFFLYWVVLKNKLREQNILLVLASYFFYGWWDWRFLSLIAFSSLVDYIIGLKLFYEENSRKRKTLLLISLLTNLGFLGFFKYYNFFLDSFVDAFSFFGSNLEVSRLNIILPVGISFYTFQTLSYTIDVYRKQMPATRNLISFFAFVSFFPQLVAGPIERASHLLPQFFHERTLDYGAASKALKMILWGLFMKVAVADRLSLYVEDTYGSIASHTGITFLVATFFFSIQIYCDFGGYSLIAIGTAKLFGFELMTNFKRPYFSSSFKEFWSRWHISLSTWFRDYVYIPLGGSKGGLYKTYVNLFLTFVISGFWHGANWTFIVWGGLHGIYQMVEKSFQTIKLPKILSLLVVFTLTNLTWVFFRANSVSDAMRILGKIFDFSTWSFHFGDKGNLIYSAMAVLVLFLNDYITEYRPQASLLNHKKTWVRYASICLIIIYIITLGVFDGSQFIYFQF